MAITSADIQNQSFKIERRGYDVDEVDVFLERVASEIDDLNDEIAHLRAQASEASAARTEIISQPEVDMVSRDELAEKDAKIAELEARLRERKSDDSAIAQALIVAQRTADEIISKAKGEAEQTRINAEEEGKPRGLAEDATDEEKKAAKAAVKESQKEFTKKLASYADCYVNDAFGTAHRAHASTALIAKYFDKDNKMFGYLMEKEVKAVDKVLNDIQRPFTAIMGGSKVSSKIEIIENLLNKVDNLIIAGGMTYTFTKAMGGKIGISICEDDKLDLALDLMKKAKEKGVNLVLAVDAKIADSFSNDANTKFCPVDEIPDGWEGLDIGPETEKIFADVIKNSKTILWNGPTGVFEFENFTHGSRAVGEAIVEATKNGAFSLVGGGDSVACVNKFGLASGVSYVSTGGGALLEAIEGKILPGIAAINE